MRSREKLILKLHDAINSTNSPPLMVTGKSGAGKSWVLEQLSERIGERPHRILQGAPFESGWSFSGLLGLLAAAPLSLSGSILAGGNVADIDHYSVAQSVQQMLLEQIAPRTVIMIDDLDLMDADSQKVIGFVATKLHGSHIRFVATMGSGTVPEPFTAFRKYNLSPLDRTSLFRVGRLHAENQIHESVLAILVSQSGGSPGCLIRHLDSLSPSQAEGVSPLHFPIRTAHDSNSSMRLKLQGLSEAQLAVLRMCSLAPLVERSALIDLAARPGDIDELVSIGHLESQGSSVLIASPLLRCLHYWAMDPVTRASTHADLARVAKGAAMAAFHASHAQDTAICPVQLIEGARAAAGREHYGAAVELAERALFIAEGQHHLPEGMSQGLTVLAQRLLLASHPTTALRYALFARRYCRSGEDQLKAAITQADILLVQGHPLSSIPVGHLTTVYGQQHPQLCARLLASAAMAHCMENQPQLAATTLEQARSMADTVPPEDLQNRIHQAQLMIHAAQQNASVLAHEFSVLTHPAAEAADPGTLLVLSQALSATGAHAKARSLLNRVLTADPSRSSLFGNMAALCLADHAIHAGNVPQALKDVERWKARRCQSLLAPLPQVIDAWYWMIKDRNDLLAETVASLKMTTADEVTRTQFRAIHAFLGEYALVRARPEEAVRHLRLALDGYGPVVDEHFVQIGCNLVDALASAGRLEDTANEFRSLQSLMATVQTKPAKLMARRAQAIALPAEASISRFMSLVEHWNADDSHFELARVHHCFGQRLLHLERREQAQRQLNLARNIYQSIGARAWAQRAAAQLRDEPAPIVESDQDMLSGAELSLVAMVHEGKTNRDIASALYVSVSAVEARMTRLFRKTGARNRQQLAARFSPTAVRRTVAAVG